MTTMMARTMTRTSTDTLALIQQWDPDGWSYREPTELDRERFERRVIARFGRKALAEYLGEEWGER